MEIYLGDAASSDLWSGLYLIEFSSNLTYDTQNYVLLHVAIDYLFADSLSFAFCSAFHVLRWFRSLSLISPRWYWLFYTFLLIAGTSIHLQEWEFVLTLWFPSRPIFRVWVLAKQNWGRWIIHRLHWKSSQVSGVGSCIWHGWEERIRPTAQDCAYDLLLWLRMNIFSRCKMYPLPNVQRWCLVLDFHWKI